MLAWATALEGALQVLVVRVVTALHARARAHRMLCLREKPEPGPRRSGLRILALQRIGHERARAASLHVGQPQRTCTRELFMQRGHQGSGQHQGAVLAALAAAHEHGTVLEIEVLDAQVQAFGDAHAGAVEQPGQQALLTLKQRQHACHFSHRQHHRQTRRAVRTADGLHPRQVLPEHLLVQEQQRRKRLPVRGDRYLPIGRQPGQKGLNLGLPHLARVAHVMEAHERAHPMDVGLLGTYAVVKIANPLTHLVQQPRGLQRGQLRDRHAA
jgi:hypothetical protein